MKNRKYKAIDYHDDDDDVDDAAEDVSNEALEETTDETADEIADEPEEEVTEESLDEVEEEAAEESVDEAAEETADEAVEEPADEVAEETAEGAADEQKMATDENISNASYVGRTVEITPDSKKAVENENSEFDLKDDSRQENVSDTENDADVYKRQPAEHVYAQGLGLSVSSSSVAVGKTVKVTVSMPSGYFGTVVISSSDEGVLSNGGDGVANIGDAAGYPTSQSFSFTAKGAGSCTIKAYCTVVGDAEGNDAGGLSLIHILKVLNSYDILLLLTSRCDRR